MQEELQMDNRTKNIIGIILAVVAVIIVLRVLSFLMNLLLPLIILGAIGFGVYYFLKKRR